MNVNDGTEPCQHCGAAHYPGAIKAYWQGRREGVAAYQGLVDMAKMIAARERAKPVDFDHLLGKTCQAKSGRYRCNFDHGEGEEHKAIGRTGRVLHSWPCPTSAPPVKS